MSKENQVDGFVFSSCHVNLDRGAMVNVFSTERDRECFCVTVFQSGHSVTLNMPISLWEQIDRAVSAYFQEKTEHAELSATSSDIHGDVS